MKPVIPHGSSSEGTGATTATSGSGGATMRAHGAVRVPDIVRARAGTSSSLAYDDRGEHALKGVADAHRLYAVRRLEGT